ncbi:hypothetical protein HanRHA438_Chr06g0273151 [Helianthus annuus]|uniref:Uncharacterized protein n=1 Tax=Helianthus annuus TaxID=4232 RepID=A0A9K3ITK5_HELAN|nr:hypothetical protein HanXRQr2_Chr06g0263861 [Helianthus annuus]KAJ0560887.1 hypothetical protein HanHA300_Chr06g0216471 [Helianthus annuus]KAJ0567346.1 hypothetical protein HanIR_Chr06g0283731 [Helianthus annuus]KAJ0573926.1 hypothetical protein HanHA89_Chr06g0232271 [Helianthus annuus]KAJ0738260.1 hypothetical protein HanLR1_Chr06g0216191 [Helianthus annuus]
MCVRGDCAVSVEVWWWRWWWWGVRCRSWLWGLYDRGLWCICRSWGLCSVMNGCLNVSGNRFSTRGARMMAMNRATSHVQQLQMN